MTDDFSIYLIDDVLCNIGCVSATPSIYLEAESICLNTDSTFWTFPKGQKETSRKTPKTKKVEATNQPPFLAKKLKIKALKLHNQVKLMRSRYIVFTTVYSTALILSSKKAITKSHSLSERRL